MMTAGSEQEDSTLSLVPWVHLSRRYRFSASHRLHVQALSSEQNGALFGKCNNPFGHGHNYVAQFTYAGAVDRTTGMIADLAELDAFAARHLADFECTNLNKLPCFAAVVPSTENLCLELWRRFRTFAHAELRRVRIEETGKNAFEYSGGAARAIPLL